MNATSGLEQINVTYIACVYICLLIFWLTVSDVYFTAWLFICQNWILSAVLGSISFLITILSNVLEVYFQSHVTFLVLAFFPLSSKTAQSNAESINVYSCGVFSQAMHLVYRALEKEPVPALLPSSLIPPSKRKKSLGSVVGSVPGLPASPPPPKDSLRSTPSHGSMNSLNSTGSLSPKHTLKSGQVIYILLTTLMYTHSSNLLYMQLDWLAEAYNHNVLLVFCLYVSISAFTQLGSACVRPRSLWRHLPEDGRRSGRLCQWTGSKGHLHTVWTFSEHPCPYMVETPLSSHSSFICAVFLFLGFING